LTEFIKQGPDLQRIVSATYELLMISGTCDELMTSTIYKESYEKIQTKFTTKLRQRQRCLKKI